MDEIMDTINRLTAVATAYVPSPLPVPQGITIAAQKLAEVATSTTFPFPTKNINLGAVSFWQAAIVIFLQPIIWNAIARFEYYTRFLSTVCLSRRVGVYLLATWIILAGLYRDALFVAAIDDQRRVESIGAVEYQVLGGALMVVGLVLVMTSFLRLGVTGTFLGDYFGILMEKRVTGFPFNSFSDPMYLGSTMLFMAKAVLAKSPAGILLSAWVHVVYKIACIFEGPFTARIYANNDAAKKRV